LTISLLGGSASPLEWVEEYLGRGEKARQEEWTESIAVGSRLFAEKVKDNLGFRGKGRAIIEASEGYQVREKSFTYNPLFRAEKPNIGPQNTYFWDIPAE
jgi:putative transposase